MRRLQAWFKALSSAGKVGVILATVFGVGVVGAVAQGPTNTPSPNTTKPPVTTPASKVETKNVTTTVSVPFTTSTVQDASLAKGTTQVKTAGINGVKTQTWAVTYTNGVETSRKLVSEVVTTAAVSEVVAQGTYVTPVLNCPNGTYVNTAGNTVCSPYSAPTAPSGATAKCGDGTYSFSQSRSGTCSHHGGVAEWL